MFIRKVYSGTIGLNRSGADNNEMKNGFSKNKNVLYYNYRQYASIMEELAGNHHITLLLSKSKIQGGKFV